MWSQDALVNISSPYKSAHPKSLLHLPPQEQLKKIDLSGLYKTLQLSFFTPQEAA
jgi:hypothetical protein